MARLSNLGKFFGRLGCVLIAVGCVVGACFIVSSDAAATPVIRNVEAPNLIDGQQITISGTGFGSGPDVLLFDNFNGGVPGAPIPLKATVGSWTSTNINPPTYAAYGLSGSTGDQIFNGVMQQFELLFPRNEQELFVSYWVALPPGTNFPSAGAPDVLSTVSSWKLVWAMYGGCGYCGPPKGPSNDVWLPAWTGAGWNLGGNDGNITYFPRSPWFGFHRFTRVSFWLKANPSDPTAPGRIAFQALQQGRGIVQSWERSNLAIFDKDNPPAYPNIPKAWDRINVPGWLKGGRSTRPVYDDVYIAAGPNSQARIEIGNARTYSRSTNLALLTPVAWGPTQIIATLHKGPFSDLNNLYVYVVDADGNVNDLGFPLGATSGSALGTDGTSTSSSSAFSTQSTVTGGSTTSSDPSIGTQGSGTVAADSSSSVAGTPISPRSNSVTAGSEGSISGASSSSGGTVSNSSELGAGTARNKTSDGNFLSTTSGAGGYGVSSLSAGSGTTSGPETGSSFATRGFTTSGGAGTTGSSSLAFPEASSTANEVSGTTPTPTTTTTGAALSAYITSPKDGSTLGKKATLSAYATSSSGSPVTLVKILVDGTLQCAGAPSASCVWDTQTATNGKHSIGVSASDGAGQTSNAQVTVTIAN